MFLRTKAVPRVAVLLALAALASCSSIGAPTRGHLVIVGGGLRSDNAEVYAAFTEGGKASYVVLPTASGVPEESGPAAVATISRYAAPGSRVEVVELLESTPERAEATDTVRAIRAADAVWFTGGVQSRVTAVFRPGALDTRAYRAVKHVLDGDGRVGGSSAGAAIMSDPMIRGGSSREALLDGVTEDGFGLEQGMGFFGFGIVDQHFLSRGRIGRLLVALDETETRYGFGIADDRALAVDLRARRATAIGERAVVFVDARDMRREGRSLLGARLSLCSSGDVVDLRDGAVARADGKRPVAPIDVLEGRHYDDLRPFAANALALLLERLSTDPTRAQSATEDGVTLTVRADERTTFHAFDDTLAGLRCSTP
ncbi:MAG: cyanophycinase [Planctomycetota bacterium]